MTAVLTPQAVDWAAWERQLAGEPEIALIDHHKALALLTEVVEEAGPDHVYKRVTRRMRDGLMMGGACLYVDSVTGEGSCGVGRALIRHGVPASTLRRWDFEGVNSAIVSVYHHFQPPWLTFEAAQVFAAFQSRQDNGEQWGGALAGARQYHGRI